MSDLSFTLLISLMNKSILAACEHVLAVNERYELLSAEDRQRLNALMSLYAELFAKQQEAAKMTYVLNAEALHELGEAIDKLAADAAEFRNSIFASA